MGRKGRMQWPSQPRRHWETTEKTAHEQRRQAWIYKHVSPRTLRFKPDSNQPFRTCAHGASGIICYRLKNQRTLENTLNWCKICYFRSFGWNISESINGIILNAYDIWEKSRRDSQWKYMYYIVMINVLWKMADSWLSGRSLKACNPCSHKKIEQRQLRRPL